MKLFADECMPRKAFDIFAALLQLHKPPIAAEHLLTRFQAGMSDLELVQELARDIVKPIVLSADSGRQTRRGDPRLPIVLPRHKISGVFLSGKMAQAGGFEVVRAVLYVLPDIVELSNEPQGTRMKLVRHAKGYHLKPWPMK